VSYIYRYIYIYIPNNKQDGKVSWVSATGNEVQPSVTIDNQRPHPDVIVCRQKELPHTVHAFKYDTVITWLLYTQHTIYTYNHHASPICKYACVCMCVCVYILYIYIYEYVSHAMPAGRHSWKIFRKLSATLIDCIIDSIIGPSIYRIPILRQN